MSSIVKEFGVSYTINRDGGIWYPPQACRYMKLKHRIQSSYEKSLIERTMQYIKDRTKKVSMITFLIAEKREIQALSYKKLVQPICKHA